VADDAVNLKVDGTMDVPTFAFELVTILLPLQATRFDTIVKDVALCGALLKAT
jgi:hypothetical protein